jgi:hypothetical protein
MRGRAVGASKAGGELPGAAGAVALAIETYGYRRVSAPGSDLCKIHRRARENYKKFRPNVEQVISQVAASRDGCRLNSASARATPG